MEERLRGGINEVVRRGGRVHRPARPWSDSVQALLAHVRAAGFPGVPAPHGRDLDGGEVLEWIDGAVGDEMQAMPREVLDEVGRMLRAYHDATLGFDPSDRNWQFPAGEPAEVILHGDPAPYNCVFRAGRPVAWIDFDTARPGPRIWDVADAAYRFGLGPFDLQPLMPAHAERVRWLVDGYGLSSDGRGELAATIVERLRWLAALIEERAAAGDVAFASHLADGHADLYRRHAAAVEGSPALAPALA